MLLNDPLHIRQPNASSFELLLAMQPLEALNNLPAPLGSKPAPLSFT